MKEIGLAIQITYQTSDDTYDKKVRFDLKFSSLLKFLENFAIFNLP